MRTRLKALTTALAVLVLMAGGGLAYVLDWVNSPTPEPAPEVVPPLFCPKEGALFKLRGYNVISITFYHALGQRVQDQVRKSDRQAELNFDTTMSKVLEIDGRLSEVFNLVQEGQLPTSYFYGLLEEKRLEALMDMLRPCPESPFLPGSALDVKDLYPQTGANLTPRGDDLSNRTGGYPIPVTFRLVP